MKRVIYKLGIGFFVWITTVSAYAQTQATNTTDDAKIKMSAEINRFGERLSGKYGVKIIVDALNTKPELVLKTLKSLEENTTPLPVQKIKNGVLEITSISRTEFSSSTMIENGLTAEEIIYFITNDGRPMKFDITEPTRKALEESLGFEVRIYYANVSVSDATKTLETLKLAGPQIQKNKLKNNRLEISNGFRDYCWDATNILAGASAEQIIYFINNDGRRLEYDHLEPARLALEKKLGVEIKISYGYISPAQAALGLDSLDKISDQIRIDRIKDKKIDIANSFNNRSRNAIWIEFNASPYRILDFINSEK